MIGNAIKQTKHQLNPVESVIVLWNFTEKAIGLDNSTLIQRWRCDASRALEVTRRHCLQYHTLLEVTIIDLLSGLLKLYSLSMLFIKYN